MVTNVIGKTLALKKYRKSKEVNGYLISKLALKSFVAYTLVKLGMYFIGALTFGMYLLMSKIKLSIVKTKVKNKIVCSENKSKK